MKISVAMCTYNGARFLHEQLESIAAQTRPPDELVVCDDGSQDDTPRIIEDFASRAPFAVRLFHNETNLGPIRNFERAISLCQGDIIALSDQDDIWFQHKLRRMEDRFKRHPHVGLIFTALKIGDELWPPLMRRSLLPNANTARKRYDKVGANRSFTLLMKHNLATGAAMAFRARFRDIALPFAPDGVMMHDEWIALVVSSVARVRFDSMPSMQYRQHEEQHTKAFSSLSDQDARRVYYLCYIHQLETLHERLSKYGAAWSDFGADDAKRKLRQIESKIAHLQARRQLSDARWKRLPTVARETLSLRYFHYSNGVRSLGVDLLQ